MQCVQSAPARPLLNPLTFPSDRFAPPRRRSWAARLPGRSFARAGRVCIGVGGGLRLSRRERNVEQTTKHTPGDLEVHYYNDGSYALHVLTAGGHSELAVVKACHEQYSPSDAANAARLAHCWNCHDDLLAVYQAARAWANNEFLNSDGVVNLDANLRAAIAKAERGAA